jgi:hypothetical protein
MAEYVRPPAVPPCLQSVLSPKQARELYAGRQGIHMDANLLLRGAALGRCTSADDPDFCSRMESLLDPGRVALPVGGPPEVHELWPRLSQGSAVTALEELPKAVLRHVDSSGLRAIVELLRRLAAAESSTLLNGVLHLCLRKKEPAWLLKNSRPVLLEPFLRRLESSVVFRRLQRSLEVRRSMPSCMLAYRRQLSPQYAAVLGRQQLVL